MRLRSCRSPTPELHPGSSGEGIATKHVDNHLFHLDATRVRPPRTHGFSQGEQDSSHVQTLISWPITPLYI